MSIDERMELAIDLARQAGALLRDGFGHAADIRHKGVIDLVTEYDLRSERLIMDGVRRAFPHDAWLAEEGGLRGSGEARWLIDPLDGTVNFAHGVPIFAVSIAFVQAGEPVLGVIYDPLRDELFQASTGSGAFLNGRRLTVAPTVDLNESLLVTGFAYDIRTADEDNLDHYAAFALRSQGVRRLGSASLDLAYVAAGRFDGYWELSVERLGCGGRRRPRPGGGWPGDARGRRVRHPGPAHIGRGRQPAAACRDDGRAAQDRLRVRGFSFGAAALRRRPARPARSCPGSSA